tara:strand:- start:263 stop:415 length:153 start_codon:yes stop_codon:yes gene_type:complete
MDKKYKALLIRKEVRDLIDEKKLIVEKLLGLDLNYSQFITYLCNTIKKGD